MNAKIHPCPFCQGINATEEFSAHYYCGSYFVYCPDCQAQGPKKETISEAVETWNTRNKKQGYCGTCTHLLPDLDEEGQIYLRHRGEKIYYCSTGCMDKGRKVLSGLQSVNG